MPLDPPAPDPSLTEGDDSSMICPECRDGRHDHCDDAHHPDRIYRGCACQHQTREETRDPVTAARSMGRPPQAARLASRARP